MSPDRMFLQILCAILCAGAYAEDVGYQYTTFKGPVSGEAEEVLVAGPLERGENTKAIDFVAKPDYIFSYGVDDPETGNSQTHEESREGDVVTGEYSVVEPDGSLRTVYYTADSVNGFQAKIERTPPIPGYRSAYENRVKDEGRTQGHQYSVTEPNQEAGYPGYYDYDDGSRSASNNREQGTSFQGDYSDYGNQAPATFPEY